MMGSKVRRSLLWVLCVLAIFSPTYGLRGSLPPIALPPNLEAAPPTSQREAPINNSIVVPSPNPVPRRYPVSPPNIQSSNTSLAPAIHSAQNQSLQSPKSSPALIASPLSHEQDEAVPVVAPSNEVNHSHEKGLPSAIIPAPPEVKNSNFTKDPAVSPSHSSGFSPIMCPLPREEKQRSNVTVSPSSSQSGLSDSSPVMSPIMHEMKPPSDAHAPLGSHLQPSGSSSDINSMPHEKNRTSEDTPSPSSHVRPLESSPGTSPAPHEVSGSSNTTHFSHPSQPLPSGFSPVKSPSPPEIKEPSNSTHAPLISHPLPLLSPPANATPPESKKPSNTTNSPRSSHPLPSEFSSFMSPTPDLKEPQNITHSPFPSHPLPLVSSPSRSPATPEVNNSSNATDSPFPSHLHPLPAESSPALSPIPHDMTGSLNNTHAPLGSHPVSLRGPPAKSPMPHAVEKPSSDTRSPISSHPLPLESSPTISPAPHEVENPSNQTHAPLASDPKPSHLSPMISPTPHEVKNPLNITHSPSSSNPPPQISPVPPPPELKNPSNITNAPLASHPKLSKSPPSMSPTPHEVKEPSNDKVPPLSSHSLRSQSSPTMSPAPHKVKEPLNITHPPLSSPHLPSEKSPAVSPVAHGVKHQSNTTHAPVSPRHPSLSSPLLSPIPHEVKNSSNITHAPLPSHHNTPSERNQTPALAPTSPRHDAGVRGESPAFAPLVSSAPSSHHPGLIISPAAPQIPAVSPSNEGSSISPVQAPSHSPVVIPKVPSLSPIHAPVPSTNRQVAHTPSPSVVIPSSHKKGPILSPAVSRRPKAPPPQPVWVFPPPPPNSDCKQLSCRDPDTYPPPGSVCVCVLPIKVSLRLNITLYTFFPLVSELAKEIASGIFVKQSQVRIMGANAAIVDPEKTDVIMYIVPLGISFDMTTALLIDGRFWHKQVLLKAFGDYEVLYVDYPGLPPAPPTASDSGMLGNGQNAQTIKPLAVDVKKTKQKLSGGLIAIVVLASVIALVISMGAAWFMVLRCRNRSSQVPQTSEQPLPPSAKPSSTGPTNLGSGPSSTSASFASSIAAHAGSARTFSLAEVERATNKFHESRIIGEGGFGRVYQGTLEDGTMVAVKVLKREDHQGGREFLAEVEMLRRLHHRNLVKLIGICTEDNIRCLVYELVPNGSVESHLHGLDKETSPLNWNSRMKIALGAARGLAYLHEDSSPRVIHRDFKSSNILLEHDFTPKVSDFGLARTALDGGDDHISTRVMGTFGYVAPEYAMTGHLLVKSDVYSYGVVLLELLTGRKPVDMSQPPGQENLVNWARPLLNSVDGLERLIDTDLGADISWDSVAKVAAIASMCVQPEVSHRPFMGEVVQALKLVCNESDEHRRSFSHDLSSTRDSDIRIGTECGLEEERVLSESDIFRTPSTYDKDLSGSFRRYSSSGPLKIERSQQQWDRVRGFSSGSITHKSGSSLGGGDH